MSTSRCGRRRRSFINGFHKTVANIFSSSSPKSDTAENPCGKNKLAWMLRLAARKLHGLCCGLRWPTRRRSSSKTKITIYRKEEKKDPSMNNNIANGRTETIEHIRLATFNAAMFSMAPAVPTTSSISLASPAELDIRGKAAKDKPMKGILKQQKFSASKRRVSINLPEDEISVERSKQLSSSNSWKGKGPAAVSQKSLSFRMESWRMSERSVMDVLREVGADVIALQNVKAEEEKGMRPLSDLAEGLGLKYYVFAESWAPEYGNAILSKWPIKRWSVHKICDDSDFRNVLKATIDVPRAGEVNFHCTYLDHLDEDWRMKQIAAILRSSDEPHILAGGLNSLNETDYSAERWNDIMRYYEEIGKLAPKVEVMKFLKGKQYSDAKNFAGECESVVVVAKGQDVQGTCKYGTRVDYILASPNSPYKFVSGSYGVISSKGTSDHHIVKVDIVIDRNNENFNRRQQQTKKRVVKIDKDSSKGIWRTNSQL